MLIEHDHEDFAIDHRDKAGSFDKLLDLGHFRREVPGQAGVVLIMEYEQLYRGDAHVSRCSVQLLFPAD